MFRRACGCHKDKEIKKKYAKALDSKPEDYYSYRSLFVDLIISE
jgi:hypothetical protein